MTEHVTETVLILGVGVPDGIGGALGRRFAAEGLHVVLGGRSLDKVSATAAEIQAAGLSAEAVRVDVTSEDDLDAVFSDLGSRGTPVASVIYNAGSNSPIAFEDLTVEQFTDFWRVCCLGGFLTAKRAMPLFQKQGRGSMLFTGASASMRGKPGFGHFSSAKGGLRNLVQALAREYGPQGVHVAHIIVDGVVDGERVRFRYEGYLDQLGEDGSLAPAAIAETFWSVHAQPRSAWTHEIDLRPFKENW